MISFLFLVKNERKGGSKDIEGAQSEIKYFRTLEYTPSEPREIKVHRNEKNPTEIKINWTEPDSPNGIIDHYEILMELRRIDEKRIMQRPFCEKKYEIKKFEFEDEDNATEPEETVVDEPG